MIVFLLQLAVLFTARNTTSFVSTFCTDLPTFHQQTKYSPKGILRKSYNDNDLDQLQPSSDNNNIPSHSMKRFQNNDTVRRNVLKTAMLTCCSTLSAFSTKQSIALASTGGKSRTDGYTVQRSERDWTYVLSGKQYNILREGGTETPNSSILEGEERSGTYYCAGCNNPLFLSSAKFHSGTGWPSFATALKGVEVEQVNPIQANLVGAELRCNNCGGHLGDVFNDGFLFVGTPAFLSGKRLCIDGAALIFKPKDGTEDVFGDLSAPKSNGALPSFLEPPKITPR